MNPRPGTDLPNDLLGHALALIGNEYGGERLLERAHELYAEDPTVIADLRYEVAGLRELIAVRHPAQCGKTTLTGDITCNLEPGHFGSHAGGNPAVAWRDTPADRTGQDRWRPALCGNVRHPYPGVPCTLPAGHDGDHERRNVGGGDEGVSWSDDDLVDAQIVCGHRIILGGAGGWQPVLECTLPDGHAQRHTGTVTW